MTDLTSSPRYKAREAVVAEAIAKLNQALHEITDASLSKDLNAQVIICTWLRIAFDNGYSNGTHDTINARREGASR